MTKTYTTWREDITQVYDQSCGNRVESVEDANKMVGAGFVMDATGYSLELNHSKETVWPAQPDDPDELADTLTEFAVLSGAFILNLSTPLFMGFERPYTLTLQRDGVMNVNSNSMVSTESKAGTNGSVRVDMYDNSRLQLDCTIFSWDGDFSINDNAVMAVSARSVDPYDHLTELHGTSTLNLAADQISAGAEPWRVSLFEGAPKLNIMARSAGVDPLQSTDAEAAYPKAIIDFASSTRGTVVLDTPEAHAFTMGLLNERGTFSVDGRVINIQGNGAFNVTYNSSVQRDGFTTGTITITKVR